MLPNHTPTIAQVILGLCLATSTVQAEPIEVWTKQLGSSALDYGRAVAVDRCGNVYIAGSTKGMLPGQQHRGGYDSFVAQYSSAGCLKWIRQWGGSQDEQIWAMEIAPNGSAWIAESVGPGDNSDKFFLVRLNACGHECQRFPIAAQVPAWELEDFQIAPNGKLLVLDVV